MIINLVGGQKASIRNLGFILPHEHLRVRSEGITNYWPMMYNEQDEIEIICKKIKECRKFGVNTIFDLTVFGLGRNINLMEEISNKTGINIVASTGLYTFTELPRVLKSRSNNFLANLFIQEIEEGIVNTNTRASILKCATDQPGVTQDVEKVIRAVAIANINTGAPIFTHSFPGNQSGLAQIKILKDEGVDMNQVVIGHSGDTEDIGYLRALLKEGVFIGLDRFGIWKYPTTEARINIVLRLIKEGFSDKILISHDASLINDKYNEDEMPHFVKPRSLSFIPSVVIPELLRRGVKQEVVDQITKENPIMPFNP